MRDEKSKMVSQRDGENGIAEVGRSMLETQEPQLAIEDMMWWCASLDFGRVTRSSGWRPARTLPVACHRLLCYMKV